MDLGKAKLRRNGTNYLHHALHPDHGMVWTDGKNIFQAPVSLYKDQVENATSTRLGEFEHVNSVHWNCGTDQDGCFMAAIHEKSVSVWRVSHGQSPRLAFKQVRKINVETLPQGCLWNPKYSDILCLLNRQQISFFFKHGEKERRHVSFPKLEHGRISCGCWSSSGNRLVVCVGTALLIYSWPDIDASVRDYVQNAWRMPGMSPSVNISSVVPATEDCFVCAFNLPLEVLCKNNNTDSFIVPALNAESQAGSDGILRVQDVPSVKDSLLNLQPDTKVQETAASLTLLQITADDKDPVIIATAKVPGLLTPDILHFQVESQCVVVGSHMQNCLQIFAVLDSRLLPAGDIVLARDQRPKGICEPATSSARSSCGVLLLVGTLEPSDATFPSKDNTSIFTLSLRFYPIRPEKIGQLFNGHGAATPTVTLTKSESLRENSRPSDTHIHTRQASYKGERPDHRRRSPDRQALEDASFKISLAKIDSGEIHPALVEELTPENSPRGKLVVEMDTSGRTSVQSSGPALEVEKADFSKSAAQFQNSKLSQQFELSENGLVGRTDVKAPTSSEKSDKDQNAKSAREKDFGAVKKNGTSSTVKPHADPVVETRQALADSASPQRRTSQHRSEVEQRDSSSAGSKSPQLSDTVSAARPKSESAKENGLSVKLKTTQVSDKGYEHMPSARPKSQHSVEETSSAKSWSSHEPCSETSRASKDSSLSSASDEKVEKPARTFQKLNNGSGDNRSFSSMDVQSRSSTPTSSLQSAEISSVRFTGSAHRNTALDDGGSMCSSFSSTDSNYEALEKQIQTQRDQIDALQKRLDQLSTMVDDTTCVFPIRYQEMSEPQSVTLQCMVRQGARRLHRKFLLDNGRLQLDPIKQAFGLLSVELILDGEALVLGANIDGYVPMKFAPGSVLQITGIPISALSPDFIHKAFPKEAPPGDKSKTEDRNKSKTEDRNTSKTEDRTTSKTEDRNTSKTEDRNTSKEV